MCAIECVPQRKVHSFGRFSIKQWQSMLGEQGLSQKLTISVVCVVQIFPKHCPQSLGLL
jgi:hypothetical protein